MITDAVYRQTMKQFPTGVTVVTSTTQEGDPCGLTVNAFTSVSLVPPLILVCLALTSDTYRAIIGRRTFAVNVLSAEQADLAKRFATKGSGKFRSIPFTWGELSVPLLNGAVAHLECTLDREVEAGDHVIMLGEVVTAVERAGQPLIFFQGSLGPFAFAPSRTQEAQRPGG